MPQEIEIKLIKKLKHTSKVLERPDLKKWLSAIPEQVLKLNLNWGELYPQTAVKLCIIPSDELIAAFLSLHHYIEELHLAGNDLGNKSGLHLAEIIASFPKSLLILDVSSNRLSRRSGTELSNCFAAMPPKLEYLDLSHNQLSAIPAFKLASSFKELPVSIKTLNLSWNELYKLDEALVKLIQAAKQHLFCKF